MDHLKESAMAECPVCRLPAAGTQPITGDSSTIACERCGAFEITDTAIATLDRHPDLRARTSLSIGQMARSADQPPFVTTYTLHEMFPAELGSIDG